MNFCSESYGDAEVVGEVCGSCGGRGGRRRERREVVVVEIGGVGGVGAGREEIVVGEVEEVVDAKAVLS